MLSKNYVTVTAGRSLFNCSPVQWEQFTNPENATPRTGLIQEAAERLGMRVEEVEGLWYVHNAEGIRFAEAERNRRQALMTWWVKSGVRQVGDHRREHREFADMRGTGRPSTGEGARSQMEREQRIAATNTIFAKLESVWLDARATLVRHSAQSEVWLNLAVQPTMPRQHSVRRIGERRALVSALQHLFDTTKRNPEIHAVLNGGQVNAEVLSTALMAEYPELACQGEAAGLCARIGLMVALQLSDGPPSELFKDLRDVLSSYDLKDTEELQHLCQLLVRQ